MCLAFTSNELEKIRLELLADVRRLCRIKKVKFDPILGSHPALDLGGRLQAIAIWHGTRIENHLSDWVSKIFGWTTQTRFRVQVNGGLREIDNLLINKNLRIALAVECKRIWNNRDSKTERDVRQTDRLYQLGAHQILSACGHSHFALRYFVFNVYGKAEGKKPYAVITGDEISQIFGSCLWSHLQWERAVIKSAVMEELSITSDPFCDHAGSTSSEIDCHVNQQSILKIIEEARLPPQ